MICERDYGYLMHKRCQHLYLSWRIVPQLNISIAYGTFLKEGILEGVFLKKFAVYSM